VSVLLARWVLGPGDALPPPSQTLAGAGLGRGPLRPDQPQQPGPRADRRAGGGLPLGGLTQGAEVISRPCGRRGHGGGAPLLGRSAAVVRQRRARLKGSRGRGRGNSNGTTASETTASAIGRPPLGRASDPVPRGHRGRRGDGRGWKVAMRWITSDGRLAAHAGSDRRELLRLHGDAAEALAIVTRPSRRGARWTAAEDAYVGAHPDESPETLADHLAGRRVRSSCGGRRSGAGARVMTRGLDRRAWDTVGRAAAAGAAQAGGVAVVKTELAEEAEGTDGWLTPPPRPGRGRVRRDGRRPRPGRHARGGRHGTAAAGGSSAGRRSPVSPRSRC
jgi:hypothetical protein